MGLSGIGRFSSDVMSVTELITISDQYEQLKQQRKRLARAFEEQFSDETAPMLIISCEGVIERVNAAALDSWGYDKSELIGSEVVVLCTAKDQAEIRHFVSQCIKQQSKPQQLTTRLFHSDRRLRNYVVISLGYPLSDGDEPKLVLYCQRATKKSADNALESLLADAGSEAVPESTIPTNRPVLGRDIDALPKRLQCGIQRCCALLGISYNSWQKIVKQPDEPVSIISIALAARLLDAFPYLAAPPYSPEDLLSRLQEKSGHRTSRAEVALMLGRQATSFSHWGNTEVAPAEVVVNLSAYLVEILDELSLDAFEHYRSLVEQEAKARGIEDIWQRGTWKGRL